MQKLFIYLKDYKKETVLGPLFKLFEAFLELLVPIIIAAVIDTGILNNDKPYVIRMCLILGVFGLVGLLFSVTAQYFAAKASVGFVTKIRSALFRHIQSLSYSEIDSIGTSTLITRITSDINQIQNGVNLTLRLFLRSPFIVFGAMIMAFTIDVKSALIFAAVIPVLSVIVFGIMLISIPLYQKVQKNLDAVLQKTRENLTGARVIRAFCKENDEIAEFKQKNTTLTDTQKYVGKISALMNPATYVVINVAVIVLIYVGAIRVEAGIITQGAVVALYNYMSQILVELIKLANLIINITKAVACGNRVQNIFETKPSICGSDISPTPVNTDIAVEFKHAYMKYGSSSEYSLSDINFTVKKGETVGIIGGTGSGKTSLINLIPRFYDCDLGSVEICGISVKNYPLSSLRDKIGIVPQKATLFAGTIRENMKWGNENATDEEIYTALEIAQAKEIVDKKDGKLDYIIEQSGKNLSGGQRQRLTIARALVKKPEILILDDSSSALDFATDAALRKALKEHCVDYTVFIVSQRTSSIMHADKIVVLDDGEIQGIGTHDSLLKECEIYREIYNSQFKEEAVQ